MIEFLFVLSVLLFYGITGFGGFASFVIGLGLAEEDVRFLWLLPLCGLLWSMFAAGAIVDFGF